MARILPDSTLQAKGSSVSTLIVCCLQGSGFSLPVYSADRSALVACFIINIGQDARLRLVRRTSIETMRWQSDVARNP